MYSGGGFLLPFREVPRIFVPDLADETQRELRQQVRDFVREVILPRSKELEDHATNATVSRELLRKSAALGLLGLEVPESYGGMELDPVTAALLMEPLGAYGSWACTLAAHAGIGTLPLLYFGNDEQKVRYLARLVSGELPASYALTEDKAGSDPAGMTTTATPVEGGWRLKGGKQFITNIGFAGLMTLFAKLPDDGPEQFTAFLVDADTPGIILGSEEHKIGIWGSSTRSVTLEDVFVPSSNLLGVPHGGKKIALTILNFGRFKLGVICLGTARECLAMATAYSRGRIQKGKPIIGFGLVRKRLAEMAARVTAMEAVVYRTADLMRRALAGVRGGGAGAEANAVSQYAMECSIVKVYCSESLFWIAKNNVLAHGGNGFTLDYGAARYFLDAVINEIFEGTNDINRLVIMEMFFRRGLMSRIAAPSFWTSYGGLTGVKRPAIINAALTLRRHGAAGFSTKQVPIGAVADNFIDLYVLDSLLAAQATRPTSERTLALELLQPELLTAIRSRLRNTAKRERTINAIVDGLPE